MTTKLGNNDGIFKGVLPEDKQAPQPYRPGNTGDDERRGGNYGRDYDGGYDNRRGPRDYPPKRDNYGDRDRSRPMDRPPRSSAADDSNNWRQKGGPSGPPTEAGAPDRGDREPDDRRSYDRSYGGDRSRNFDGDRSRGYDNDRPRNFDRPRGYESERPRNYEGDRSRGYEGERSRGYEVERSRGYDGDRSRGYDGDRSRGYDGDRSRGYDGDRSRGYDRPRGYEGDRPRGEKEYDGGERERPKATVDIAPLPGAVAVKPAEIELMKNLSLAEIRQIAADKKKVEEERLEREKQERAEALKKKHVDVTAPQGGAYQPPSSLQDQSAPARDEPRSSYQVPSARSSSEAKVSATKTLPGLPVVSSTPVIVAVEVPCKLDTSGLTPYYYTDIPSTLPNIYRLTSHIINAVNDNNLRDLREDLKVLAASLDCVAILQKTFSVVIEQSKAERFVSSICPLIAGSNLPVESIEKAVQLCYCNLYKITSPVTTPIATSFEAILSKLAEDKLISHYPCFSEEAYKLLVDSGVVAAAETVVQQKQDTSNQYESLFTCGHKGDALADHAKAENIPRNPELVYHLLKYMIVGDDMASLLRQVDHQPVFAFLSLKVFGKLIMDHFEGEDVSVHADVLQNVFKFCVETSATKEIINALFFSFFMFDLVYEETFDFWKSNFRSTTDAEKQVMSLTSSIISEIIGTIAKAHEDEDKGDDD